MTVLTRAEFESFHERLAADAARSKLSEAVITDVQSFYERLDEADRKVVDGVLADWQISGDEARRFDAGALIDLLQIRSALPAVRSALEALKEAEGWRVPYDREVLERTIAKLESPPEPPQ
jgi:hypothetical protein